jgi:hypothetical protein
MNSVSVEDKNIIFEIIWATSNITAGTWSQVESVVFSNLPKLVLQYNKFKKDNRVNLILMNFRY